MTASWVRQAHHEAFSRRPQVARVCSECPRITGSGAAAPSIVFVGDAALKPPRCRARVSTAGLRASFGMSPAYERWRQTDPVEAYVSGSRPRLPPHRAPARARPPCEAGWREDKRGRGEGDKIFGLMGTPANCLKRPGWRDPRAATDRARPRASQPRRAQTAGSSTCGARP